MGATGTRVWAGPGEPSRSLSSSAPTILLKHTNHKRPISWIAARVYSIISKASLVRLGRCVQLCSHGFSILKTSQPINPLITHRPYPNEPDLDNGQGNTTSPFIIQSYPSSVLGISGNQLLYKLNFSCIINSYMRNSTYI